MIKHLISSALVVFAIGFAQGQEWVNLQREGASFEEVKSAMKQRFEGKSTIKGTDNYSSAYKKYARWEYYWRFQLDEKGDFVTTSQVMDTWYEVQAAQRSLRNSATANWTFVGPDTIPTATAPTYAGMGRKNCIAFHPTNNNIFYVGAPNGGLWKTVDGGLNWTRVGGNLPVMGVSDIAIVAGGNTIYIATGDADGQHSTSVGLLKSTDGGNSFVATGLTNTVTDANSSMFQIHHVWVKPDNINIVIATTTDGIMRSTNAGTTFTNVDPFAAHDLKQDPNNSSVLYSSSIGDVLKSSDSGATWNVVHSLTGAQKIDIGVSAANSNVVYLVSDNALGAKSIDGGTTWTATFNMPVSYNSQGGYNMTILPSPNDADTVLLGGVSGWSSSDGGVTWSENMNGVWMTGADPGKYVHSDHHMFEYHPNTDLIYACHDGGIHKGNFHDVTAPWTDLSDGLFTTQFYGMDGFPGNENILIAGAQDQDGVFFNGTNWININNNSDGTGGVINYQNSNISYCKSQSGTVNRTLNAWTSFNDVSPFPNDSTDAADFVWPLEMDPVNPSILYAGYGNIYKTTDQGNNWNDITNEVDVTLPYTSISVAPSDAMTIYAVRANNEIKRTTNGGTTWTTLTIPAAANGIPITSVEVSRTDATKVYFTLGGYVAGQKIYVSTNSGATWTNFSTGVPNLPVFTVIESAANGTLYLGTQIGVYERATMATTWAAFNTNLPNVSVREFDIHEASNTLRAATFGLGIWKTSLGMGDCPSAAIHTWVGATSENWEDPSNWSTGCVPTSNNVVFIPPGTTFDPTIANSIAATASQVTIQANGWLNVESGGSLTLSMSAFLVELMGQLEVESGAVITVP